MANPLKTAQFAEIRIVGEALDFDANPTTGGIPLTPGAERTLQEYTVGLATSLRIQETLGSTQRNVIGTPMPIFIPGFYGATITAEKATLDLQSWKTLANINPYTAYLPQTYETTANGQTAPIPMSFPAQSDISRDTQLVAEDSIPRFLFLVYVYDRIEEEDSKPFGVYAAMLQNYSTALQAAEAVIMDEITMVARPVSGSWAQTISQTFNLSTYFGYDSAQKPQQ